VLLQQLLLVVLLVRQLPRALGQSAYGRASETLARASAAAAAGGAAAAFSLEHFHQQQQQQLESAEPGQLALLLVLPLLPLQMISAEPCQVLLLQVQVLLLQLVCVEPGQRLLFLVLPLQQLPLALQPLLLLLLAAQLGC
jgi:hypothetical protein